jgi:alpha-glucosidase
VGDYLPVCVEDGMLAYIREADGRRFLVALNLSHKPGLLEPPGHFQIRGRVRLGTDPEREGTPVDGRIELAGDEGVVVEMMNDE